MLSSPECAGQVRQFVGPALQVCIKENTGKFTVISKQVDLEPPKSCIGATVDLRQARNCLLQ